MKETKYKDYKGLETKNTPTQFDQFEGQSLISAKNRWVYDFSFDDRNLGIAGGEGSALRYGEPADQINIIKDSSTSPLTKETPTINEDESTYFFNEDSLIFTNAKPGAGIPNPPTFAAWDDFFRSGYVEFTIKTDKQNCVIASGSNEYKVKDVFALFALYGSEIDSGVTATSLIAGDTAQTPPVSNFNNPYYHASSTDLALFNLNIEIKNGKLLVNYFDDYNRDAVNFQFVGNENIADNNWHHIVVNFGRPGIIKDRGVKFNKKYIEIWVDGQLDKRFDDLVNEFNIFYPTINFLLNSVKSSVDNVLNDLNLSESTDYYARSSSRNFVGFEEILRDETIFELAVAHPKNKINAFRGAFHTFAHGLNIPISKYEIQERFGLWQRQTRRFAKIINVNATIVEPAVTTNSKKAIKLFWNNLVNSGKNGLELDDNLQVESFSVTHQSLSSKTEIYNLDIAENKELNIFEDVRVALTDNVLVLGPAMVMMQNTPEAFPGLYTEANSASNWNPKELKELDTATLTGPYKQDAGKLFYGPRMDLSISGLQLNPGDRILLTGQVRTEENGIWIFNGRSEYMTRPLDALAGDNNKLNIVYVTEGFYKNTYWKLEEAVSSIDDPQKWGLLNSENTKNIAVDPVLKSRWKDNRGVDRFINLQDDINLSNYDVITFMNYPESNDEIFDHFPNESKSYVLKAYNDFVNSLKTAAANGASLYVSSPKLAEDLKIVKTYSQVPQFLENSDARSAQANPFEPNESADKYFDTHRNNLYQLVTEVPGLTNKETYIITDVINYIPENYYNSEEWHIKYAYRQFGLKEGNEFFIPSLAIREATENENIPGDRNNYRGTKDIAAVALSDILAGTVVTELGNSYYNGSTVTQNPYDDYATTIIVHNGQLLDGTPINGKIFVNCVEDGYSLSREEYNKGIIQVVPQNEISETASTRLWQYSTKRLKKSSGLKSSNGITEYGQTVPSNGGGGPIIQAPTSSSIGIIRDSSDIGNPDFESDLYPSETEEIYVTQEIPVLSMTWLGLQWLIG
jgi:hypothetical protein